MRIKNPNIYRELNDCYELCLTCNSEQFYIYFDKNMYNVVNKHHWRMSSGFRGKYYVLTNLPKINNKQRGLLMHHLIMNFKYDGVYEIDHINGNGLDNRCSNLRIVTRVQNLCNKCKQSNNLSNVSGVYFDKDRNKYAVEIRRNNMRIHLNRYNNIEDAIYVRLLAENYLFGEYRYTLDDNYKNLLISNISTTRKIELKSYVTKKLGDLND